MHLDSVKHLTRLLKYAVLDDQVDLVDLTRLIRHVVFHDHIDPVSAPRFV